MKEMDEVEKKQNPTPVELTSSEHEGKKKREHLLLRIIRIFLKTLLRKRSVDDVTDEEITREITKRKLSEHDKNDSNSPIGLFLKAREVAAELEKKAEEKGEKRPSKEEFDSKLDQLVQEGFVKDGKIWASRETLKRIIVLRLTEDQKNIPKNTDEEERMMQTVDQMAGDALKDGLPLSFAEVFVKFRAIQQFVEAAKAKGKVDQKIINSILTSPELNKKVSEGFSIGDRYFTSRAELEQTLTAKLGRAPTESEIATAQLQGISLDEHISFLLHAPAEKKAEQEIRADRDEELHKIVGEVEPWVMSALNQWRRQAERMGKELSLEEIIDIVETNRKLGPEHPYVPIVGGELGEKGAGDLNAGENPLTKPLSSVDSDSVREELEAMLGRSPTESEVSERVKWFEARDRQAMTMFGTSYEDAPPHIQSEIDHLMNYPYRSMAGGAVVPAETPESSSEGTGNLEQPPGSDNGGNGNGSPRSELARDPERRQQINDIDDLVERMADVDPQWQWKGGGPERKRWMKTGRFPLAEIGPKGELIINQANFMRWIRERMLYVHNNNSDDPQVSFWRDISVQRGISQVNLGEITNKVRKYFRSDFTGNLYEELGRQVIREVWLFHQSRTWDIQYKAVIGQEQDLPKAILQMFYYSIFTKTAWGGSTLFYILTLPQEFDSNPITPDNPYMSEEKQKKVTDSKIGAAVRTSLLAYYNLSDIEKLQEILGPDASIFKKDKLRVHLKRVNKRLNVIANKPNSFYGLTEDGEDDGTINGLTPEDVEILDKIFDSEGNIKNLKNYREYINLFFSSEKENKVIQLVRGLIQESVAKRYGLEVQEVDEHGRPKTRVDENGQEVPVMTIDNLSVEYAETFAYTMARWMGFGARNDNNARAFDALSKVLNTTEYRNKQFSPGRGGGFGNPFTVKNIKQLAADFLVGVRTETIDREKTIETGQVHYKSPLQILEEADRADRLKQYGVQTRNGVEISVEEQRREKMHELLFPENTMRSYALNHLNNAYNIFYNLMSGEELNIDKFVNFDVYGRIVFEEAKFSEAIKEKFFKPMRYAYDTYDQLDFTQKVRDWNPDWKDANGETVGRWEDKSLAEAMFGREILDIPEFWKREYAQNPDGSIKKDIHNKPIVLRILKHEIDPERIQQNKSALWKQLALTRLAGEFWAHRTKHVNYDRRYLETYEKIYAALESIPGGLGGDFNDMTKLKYTGSFFSKEDIKWLRKKSKTEFGRLFAEELGLVLMTGGFVSLKDLLKNLYSYVTK